MTLNIDGEYREVIIEIKTMSAIVSQNTASVRANETNYFLWCTFCDKNFKQCIENKLYRVQTIHHALIMKVNMVLFTIADKNTATNDID